MITKPIFTLLSKQVAKPGYTFQYLGENEICKSCPTFKVCLGRLEENELYSVIKVKKKKIDCKLIEEKAIVVQIKSSIRKLAVNTGSAVIGTSIKIQNVNGLPCCDNCLCQPDYVKVGKRYTVKKVVKKTYDCPFYASRALVEVEPS